jgi:uncharacterized protein YkwD
MPESGGGVKTPYGDVKNIFTSPDLQVIVPRACPSQPKPGSIMLKVLPIFLVMVAATVVWGGGVALSPAAMRILDLTNAERKLKDLPPLKPNALLGKVAQAHAENMARQGKMEHKLDGKTPLQRLKAAGYAYNMAFENIGAGDPDVPLEDLMKAWMDSKGHRDNILTNVCTEIGLGVAKDKNGQVYYTQLFGKPK